MTINIIDTGKNSAEANMLIDGELLQKIDSLPTASLHFYEWEAPSITYGYFNTPQQHLNLNSLESHGFQLARRPTGGGIIFHSFDFAFSVLLSSLHPRFSINTIENYAIINKIILNVVQEFTPTDFKIELHPCCKGVDNISLISHDKTPELQKKILAPESKMVTTSSAFCMAKPTVYDVVIQNRKIAGGAQRRTKAGFLHQASIALTLPTDEFLTQVLLPGSTIADAIKKCSYPILPHFYDKGIQDKVVNSLKDSIVKAFSSFFS